MSRRSPWRVVVAIAAGLVLAVGVMVPAQLTVGAQPAQAADASNFDPSNIIADRYFYDANAMSAADIQAFLDAQIGGCQNGACLNVISIAFPGAAQYNAAKTGNLVCTAIPAEVVPVSTFIFQVQQACGISAKVILVTLQKEEALITGPSAQAPSQGRLNIAMGYACPDTAACDTRYYGVANQIYWGAWQFKIYSAGNFFRQPGLNYIQYSPNASCGGTTLNIQNYATAALYNYTPYQPDPSALANLYGSGDACASYGNRNFWRYYTDWFGNPLGNPPIGWLDTATVSGSDIIAKGWSIDTDAPTGAVPVQMKIDGAVVASGYASTNRPGLGAAVLPAAGDDHGYTLTASASVGTHTVCVIGLDVGPNGGAGPSTLLHGGADAANNCAIVVVSPPPVGWMDSASLIGSKVTATGWSIDPDTAAAVQVQLVVDGATVATATANLSRPGLAAAIGSSAGDNHAYSLSTTLSVGTHTVCVIGVNDEPGPNATLLHSGADASNNCAIVSYAGPKPPMGWMDSATLSGSTVTAKGWTIDPDTAGPVNVQLLVDGDVVATGSASLDRPGLGAAILPAAGDDHGYALSATVSVAPHTVCVVALDDAGGPSTKLSYGGPGASDSCAAVAPKAPIGWMDSASLLGSKLVASGWSIDPDTPTGSVKVQLVVDGAVVSTGTANAVRPGLGAAVLPGAGDAHGYTVSATVGKGTHTVCVVALDDAGGPSSRLLFGGAGANDNCASVTYTGPRSPIGWLDSATIAGAMLTASGWAIDPDTAGPVQVQLLVDGGVVGTATANLDRPGLGAAVLPAAGDDHGYSLSTAVGVGTHTVCVVALDDAGGPSTRLSYGGSGASNNCATVRR